MSTGLQVIEVPVQHTVGIWPQIEGFIAASLAHAQGEITPDEARVYVTEGLWSLVVVMDREAKFVGALLVQYYNRIRDRVAFIIAFGGRHILNSETFQMFASILRQNGATCIEGGVRKTIARLLKRYGFEKKYSIVSASLMNI